jgi:hypothetical protein
MWSLNEPERCCESKQYSWKISSSSGMVLSDGIHHYSKYY